MKIAEIHDEPHPKAGVRVRIDPVGGSRIHDAVVIDWADRWLGKPWRLDVNCEAGCDFCARMFIAAAFLGIDVPAPDEDVVAVSIDGGVEFAHNDELIERTT